MGRDLIYRGEGVGDMLLRRAFERTLAVAKLIGVAFLVVDAKHGKASWYEARGFTLAGDPDRLVLPVKSIA
ncbi:hypothetical protein DB30_01982 [Enhygromyxa salina]|uniref:N-acetyltransferase domain-containing protein n=1 Tax=Enhygromyxa salina TaxID=215803 RepID=A0A0C2D909_9BACT|nr:GNAT family N-acetyltransferase [Enhygromyxa salina]KIG18095.1 hypothetical protein DB30_01982 [Enhygromyxa salina]